MGKYIIAAIAVILIAAGGYYWYSHRGAATPAPSEHVQQPAAVATTTYATSTYSVVYPADFTVDPAYAYDQFPGKPIAGTKFTIPTSMATGTNLANDSYLSIEQLPHAKKCTGDIYVVPNVTATSVTDNGVTYSVATTSGAAAGNIYEEQVYAIASSSPCTAIRYWIHTTQIGNYPEGTVREYDRSALLSAFDAIRRSVSLTQ